MKNRLTYLILSMMLILSCSPVDIKEQLKNTDSLSKAIKEVEQRLKSDTINTYRSVYEKVNFTNNYFRIYLVDFPMDNKIVKQQFYQYSVIERTFKRFFKKYDVFLNEIKLSRKQIKNLKHDVSEKLLNKGEFEIYFTEESDALRKLQDEIDLHMKKMAYQSMVYDTIHTDIENFKEELMMKIHTQKNSKQK